MTEQEYINAYNEYKTRLVFFAVGILKDRDAAEDAVSLAFEKMLKLINEVNAEKVKAFLFVAVKNNCYNEIKRIKRLAENQNAYVKETDEDVFPQMKWEDAMIEAEMIGYIVERAKSLPPRQQEIFFRRITGQSCNEISIAMKVRVSTITTQLQRAFDHLREHFNPFPPG